MDKTTVHRGRDFGTGINSEGRQENELRSNVSSEQYRGRHQGTGVPKHMEAALDNNEPLKGSTDQRFMQDNQDNQDKEHK
jgi:hypothetical protein